MQTFLKSTVLANRQTGALRCKRLRNWACNLEPAVSFEIPLCKKSAICQTFLRVDSSFLRSPNSSEKPLALKSGPDSAAPGPRFEGKWTRMLLHLNNDLRRNSVASHLPSSLTRTLPAAKLAQWPISPGGPPKSGYSPTFDVLLISSQAPLSAN